MGVPSDMAELARSGVLSADGVARAGQDLELPPTARDGDVSVAGYVGARLGGEVVDRLVDPLLGGVYAGRSAELSFDATLPALAAASRRHRSLAEAARSLLPPQAPGSGGTRAGGPVFTTLTGGLGMLPAYLAKVSGAEVRTGAMARELAPAGRGWRLTVGSAAAPGQVDADAVILASRRGPRAACWRAFPARRPRSRRSARSATRAWRSSRSPIRGPPFPAPAWPPSAGAGTWCLPWTGGPSRRSPSPRSSGRTWPLRLRPAAGRGPGDRALLGRPDRRGSAAAARRRRAGRAGGGRTGGGDRGAGRTGRHQGDPLGRRAAPVHGGAPGPGGRDPCGGGGPAGARGLRRGLRRGGHTGLRRDRARGGRPGAGVPRGQAAGRTTPVRSGDRRGRQWGHG